MWGTAKLLSEGVRIDGVLVASGPAKESSKTYFAAGSEVRSVYRLRVQVTFEDGATAEFEQDVPDHFDYSPPVGVQVPKGWDPIQQLYVPAFRVDPGQPARVPIPYVVGEPVPVRHDTHRRKFAIDLAVLRERVIPQWLANQPDHSDASATGESPQSQASGSP